MAYLSEHSGHASDHIVSSWKAVAGRARELVMRFATISSEDGSDLRPASRTSSLWEKASADKCLDPEAIEQLRRLVEEGYFEEVSGKRVSVPPYIRSMIASELRLLF